MSHWGALRDPDFTFQLSGFILYPCPSFQPFRIASIANPEGIV